MALVRCVALATWIAAVLACAEARGQVDHECRVEPRHACIVAETLAAVRRVPHTGSRIYRLIEAAEIVAKGGDKVTASALLTEAHRLVPSQADELDRRTSLRRLAEGQATAGFPAAAHAIARELPTGGRELPRRREALTGIALASALSGDPSGTRRALAEIQALAPTLDPNDLVVVAKAQVAIGDLSDARRTLARAEALWRGSHFNSPTTLLGIAALQLKASAHADGTRNFDAATRLLGLAEGRDQAQDWKWRSLADAQAGAGFRQAAFDTNRRITNAAARMESLLDIARQLSNVHDLQGSEMALEQARQASAETNDSLQRDAVLLSCAHLQADWNRPWAALRDARAVGSGVLRAYALAATAQALSRLGRGAEALATIAEGLGAARSVTDEEPRAFALLAITEAVQSLKPER